MGKRLFIVCTPRTGNTWLRKLLAGALGLPEYAAHAVEEIAWLELPPGCVISMHVHNTPVFRRHLDDLNFRVIVTVRHPLDVLVSILQFSQHEPATARWVGGDCGDESALAGADPLSREFLDYCLSDRAAVLLSVSLQWMADAAAVVRYEPLVESPQASLSELLDRLKLSSVRPLQQIVAENTIDKLRKDLSQYHFWRGTPSLWKRLLPADVAIPILNRHRSAFERLGYACDYDPRLTREQARNNWNALGEVEPQRTDIAARRIKL